MSASSVDVCRGLARNSCQRTIARGVLAAPPGAADWFPHDDRALIRRNWQRQYAGNDMAAGAGAETARHVCWLALSQPVEEVLHHTFNQDIW